MNQFTNRLSLYDIAFLLNGQQPAPVITDNSVLSILHNLMELVNKSYLTAYCGNKTNDMAFNALINKKHPNYDSFASIENVDKVFITKKDFENDILSTYHMTIKQAYEKATTGGINLAWTEKLGRENCLIAKINKLYTKNPFWDKIPLPKSKSNKNNNTQTGQPEIQTEDRQDNEGKPYVEFKEVEFKETEIDHWQWFVNGKPKTQVQKNSIIFHLSKVLFFNTDKYEWIPHDLFKETINKWNAHQYRKSIRKQTYELGKRLGLKILTKREKGIRFQEGVIKKI